MVNFLNDEISGLRNPDAKAAAAMEGAFRDAMDLAFTIWGPDNAFRK